MQARLSCLLGTLITASLATVASADSASPGAADGASPGADAAAPAADPAASSTPAATKSEDPDAVHYGVALRIRNTRLPNGIMQLFVEHGAGGASNVGFGGELIRRKGTVELQLGFEYEHINIGEGVWIESGKTVSSSDASGADYVLSPEHAPNGTNFGWFTVEFTFLNHAKINKYLAFRYGGGAGIGIMTGDVYHYDLVTCGPGASNNNVEPCTPTQRGGAALATGPVKYDLPPVFPVVNAIIGLQLKPTDKAVINIEGGIRTMPFFGVSAGYFF